MLFETMLVVNGRAVHLEEHFARIVRSAEMLGFPALSFDAFRDAVSGATRSGAVQIARSAPSVILSREDDEGSQSGRSSHFEILRFAQDDGRGRAAEAVRCTYGDDGTLHAEAIAIPAATLERRQNARAITLPASIARTRPEHKLVEHYDVAREALQVALAKGANEALFVEDHGACREGTATNLFAVRGTTLITASENILPGVVRAWTLARAQELGFSLEYRAPSAEELREGAFLTGSLTMLAPLRVLDGEPCRAPDEAFDELARLYREEIRRQNAPRD